MIGLLFGETDFPKQILKKLKNKKEYLIIDLTKNKTFKKDRNSYSVSLGQFGKIIEILKENKCKRVLFAGKVKKPKFSKLRLDFKGVYYMPRIIKSAKLGDAAILKEIINILKKEKIKTISSLTFNPELTLKKGNYSKIKPNKQDIISIKKGQSYFNKSNDLDHIQALVVKDGRIIAKEGKEGTKKMLSKLKIIKDGILIKLPKRKQDLRMDLPTIGLQTLKDIKKHRLRGVVLKSKKNIFLDKKKVINFANKNKIFINII